MSNSSFSAPRKIRNKISESPGDRVLGVLNIVIVTILILVLLYPFYYCVVLAFNDGKDAMEPGIYFFPRKFSLDSFKEAFSATGLLHAAFISVARTVIGTASLVLVTSSFAYAISKNYLRFNKFYFTFMIIPMFFSGGIVSSYILIRNYLHLYNNFLIYVLPGMFNIFYALIFLASFRDLPASLEESAMLDGANHITIFSRLILPVSKPVIAAICVFTAVGHWNSWQDTMIFTNKGDLSTLSYKFAEVASQVSYIQKLAETSGEGGKIQFGITPMSIQLAAMIISVAPVMVVYPFFQKYFVRGVMIGAIKG